MARTRRLGERLAAVLVVAVMALASRASEPAGPEGAAPSGTPPGVYLGPDSPPPPPGAAAGDCLFLQSADAALKDPPPPFGGLLVERPKLTGDWLGLRGSLRDCGITVDVSTTQFYQGVASGGLERSFPYGGRNDYFLSLDGEKLGLWKGSLLKVHGETRYGETASFLTGALSPVNEFLLVPDEDGIASGLTGVEFTQVLTENLAVSAGKINLLDHVHQPLTGATGLEGFLNLSLIFNPILARTLPYSAFGAGGVYLQDGEPVLALSVFDTRDASTTSIFDDFFTDGAVIFGTALLPTKFFGLPGHQGIEGVYSSGRYTNVDDSPYLDPLGGLVFPGPPKAGSWAVGYLFDQALWASPCDPKRVWGVFGKLGISDGNPNPVRWNAGGGISGASPIRGRSQDTFGVGFYHLEISSALKRSAMPLTPLRNEQGVELYYNARVTPWFQLTPDLQIIEPFQRQVDTAWVVGVRARIDF
jgi:porin